MAALNEDQEKAVVEYIRNLMAGDAPTGQEPCSFCGKGEDEVALMIRKPPHAICDECGEKVVLTFGALSRMNYRKLVAVRQAAIET